MQYREHVVPVARRVELFVREFNTPQGAGPSLVLLHGAAEHGGRHRHVAERLCRSGWRVLVPDLRGHGRSGGRPMYVSRFADYIEDLEQFYDWFSLSPETTAQLGVSMGGLVTVRFAQTHPDRLAAIALSSPLLGLAVRISPMLLASGRFLSLAYPWKQFRTVVELSDVTRSRESLEQRRADPLCRRIVTAGWFFAVRAAITNAWRDASSLALPVLVVQSGDDRVVDGAAAQAWINRIASADRLFHELPGQFHELHYETSWRATVDLYHNWLAARVVPPLASPATMARAA